MIIISYLGKKWFSYIIVFALVLNTVFLIIEAFEKYTRSTQTSFAALAHLIYLNSIHGWFDALPTANYLSGIMLLRELQYQGTWETLFLISIKRSDLLRYAFGGGILLCIAAMLPYETIIRYHKHSATLYKQTTFKHTQQTTFDYDCWYFLNNNILLHAISLDRITGHGNELLIIQLDEKEGEPECIMTAPKFFIDFDHNKITLTNGVYQKYDCPGKELRSPIAMDLTSLKTQLLNQPSSYRSLPNLISLLLHKKYLLPTPLYKHLLTELLEILFYYLSHILYPVLSITLWLLLLSYSTTIRWFLVLALFPLLQVLFFTLLFIVR